MFRGQQGHDVEQLHSEFPFLSAWAAELGQLWAVSPLPPVSVFPPVRWTLLGVKDRKVSEVPAERGPKDF